MRTARACASSSSRPSSQTGHPHAIRCARACAASSPGGGGGACTCTASSHVYCMFMGYIWCMHRSRSINTPLPPPSLLPPPSPPPQPLTASAAAASGSSERLGVCGAPPPPPTIPPPAEPSPAQRSASVSSPRAPQMMGGSQSVEGGGARTDGPVALSQHSLGPGTSRPGSSFAAGAGGGMCMACSKMHPLHVYTCASGHPAAGLRLRRRRRRRRRCHPSQALEYAPPACAHTCCICASASPLTCMACAWCMCMHRCHPSRAGRHPARPGQRWRRRPGGCGAPRSPLP